MKILQTSASSERNHSLSGISSILHLVGHHSQPAQQICLQCSIALRHLAGQWEHYSCVSEGESGAISLHSISINDIYIYMYVYIIYTYMYIYISYIICTFLKMKGTPKSSHFNGISNLKQPRSLWGNHHFRKASTDKKVKVCGAFGPSET